jgi:hypothetical protein
MMRDNSGAGVYEFVRRALVGCPLARFGRHRVWSTGFHVARNRARPAGSTVRSPGGFYEKAG